MIPLLSYNYAQQAYNRCRQIMVDCVLICVAFMLIGVFCFEWIPVPLLRLFSGSIIVHTIGAHAFRVIGLSFLPAVLSLMTPVFFQAIGAAIPSVLLTLTRQIFCLIPLFWLFSLLGLEYTWLAFPLSELITGGLGLILYFRQLNKWKQ